MSYILNYTMRQDERHEKAIEKISDTGITIFAKVLATRGVKTDDHWAIFYSMDDFRRETQRLMWHHRGLQIGWHYTVPGTWRQYCKTCRANQLIKAGFDIEDCLFEK
jgi:hypothetical protein